MQKMQKKKRCNMLQVSGGIVMNKTQYTSPGTGTTYYTLNVAVLGCSDMIDIGVDQAKYTQTKTMDTIDAAVGYSRGRFELLQGV
jgi:hypothetical protein